MPAARGGRPVIQVNPGEFQVSVVIAPNTTGSERSAIVILGNQVYRVFQDKRPLIGCDVNHDGSVNVGDAIAILRQILGLAPATWEINGDGVVNILDLQIIVNAVLDLGCDG
jgi:hypothetical protein